jgi:bifunctional non-homologous end joining protein LigD
MLATDKRQPLGDGWAYDAKVDGWRAVVHVSEAGVAVYSRPGRDITAAMPSLHALTGVVPVGTVLDGELVAGSGVASSFYRLATLMATRPARRPAAVSFVAFDVLALDGRGTTAWPYRERRRLLDDLAFVGPAWCTSRCWTAVCLDELLAACEVVDIEGVVAKREDSTYRPGQRSRDWVKLKTPGWRIHHGPYRHEYDRDAPRWSLDLAPLRTGQGDVSPQG